MVDQDPIAPPVDQYGNAITPEPFDPQDRPEPRWAYDAETDTVHRAKRRSNVPTDGSETE